MASLVLGAAGAFVGSFFGPIGTSIGWSLGSMLGSALEPKPDQVGPRLSDLKVQGSSYGAPIPIIYGAIRLSGQVIWTTDLIEHEHTTGGKGSGPEVTTFTYTASFAVGFCEGPVESVRRIWADGTLVYDSVNGMSNADWPMTIYLGTETQLPDPTMEAELDTGESPSIGQAPAHRGMCYIVMTDLELGDYGNRMPSLTAEIASQIDRVPLSVIAQETGPFTFPGPYGPDYLTIEGGELTAHYPTLYAGTRFNGPFDIVEINGTEYTYTELAVSTGNIPFSYPGGFQYFENWSNYFIGYLGEFPVWYQVDGHAGLNTDHLVIGGSTFPGHFYHGAIPGDQLKGFTLTQDGEHLWVFVIEIGTGFLRYDVWDSSPAIIKTVYSTVNPFASGRALPPTIGLCFTVDNAQAFLWLFNAAAPIPICEVYSIHPTSGQLTLVESVTFDTMGTNEYMWAITKGDRSWLVTGNQVIVFDRSGSPCIPLSDIVADLSDRAGLLAGVSPGTDEYDVTELENDIVCGYLIGSQMSARTAMEPLLACYFFDGVESDDQVVFVKRIHDSIMSIPDDELAAYEYGGEAPAILMTTRQQESELPAQMSVLYLDESTDYQQGTENAFRMVGESLSIATLQAPLVLTGAEAKGIADALLFNSWLERERYQFTTSRKYAVLEPTDVITIQDKNIRITGKHEEAGGVIKFDATRYLRNVFVQAGVPNPGSGFVPITPPLGQETALLLLDIPLVEDIDFENGYYAAMAGAVNSSWRGAVLFKSSDGGANYAEVAASSNATVMGLSATVLGDYAGGNTFDEINAVTVVIGVGGGTLDSNSEIGVLNGANKALLGEEIFQFKTATLTVASTYVLTGLLRGRRGTEWAMTTHQVGERFVLLPTTDVDAPFSEITSERLFKAVTRGSTLANTAALAFTNNGAALAPYSPVEVAGSVNGAGDVAVQWVRRTRKGGTWAPFVDVPLSEEQEMYVLQIWNSDYTQVARIQTGIITPTFVYTAAMQVVDFGATQQTIFLTVGQLGKIGLGHQAKAEIPGAGGSNSAPLNPVPPYQSPPPTGGCTLPTQTDAWVWTDPMPSFIDNPAADANNTWLISFTTPGSPVSGPCNVYATAFAGPPVYRDMVLAGSPCGAPLQPGAIKRDISPNINFYMQGNPDPAYFPTLNVNTTYYVSIDSDSASACRATLFHS